MVKSLTLTILLSTNVYADVKNQPIYTKSITNQMSPESAILQSASGEAIYKCDLVEAKVSKSGTSVSLRKKKKQITAEDAAQKIEEIKKQVGE